LTRWSVVLAVGGGDEARTREALEQLCRCYWRPIYCFVRRQGYSPHDAEDLTQGFFAQLLAGKALGAAEPAKGRFRSYLLVVLKHFLANESRKARAWKRGGREVFVPFDLRTAETAFMLDLAGNPTAEKIFDRNWALALLDTALERLRAEYAGEGKTALFQQLCPTLRGERTNIAYSAIGVRMGLGEDAVKVVAYRLRQRYRQLLREEIAHTLAHPENLEEELRALFAALEA
jgi:RNA polymerase sigma-70 factor (ECF subfamily)